MLMQIACVLMLQVNIVCSNPNYRCSKDETCLRGIDDTNNVKGDCLFVAVMKTVFVVQFGK